jgi:glycosyltransferase involved in cell wall biosynthesis
MSRVGWGRVLIADSHEFLELYRGDKDFRLMAEMVRSDEEVQVVSFGPESLSPTDARRFGRRLMLEVGLPALPDRMSVHLLKSAAVRFARKESGGVVAITRGYRHRLLELRPDVVFENPFSWLTPRSYATWRACSAMGVPLVYYDPGDDIPISLRHRVMAVWESPVVRSTAAIITYNQAGANRFVAKYGCDPNRIHVIPKPVDVARMRPRVSPATVRTELGIPQNALVVAYVGRLADYKGSRVLLDLAKRALEAGDKRVHFLFIGGALASEQQDVEYSLPNTTVTGMVDNELVPRIMSGADIAVFPDVAHPGAFPTAVAEAMAAGKPMIVGSLMNSGHLPLRDGVDAVLVEPGSREAIAAAIEMLACNEVLRRTLGERVGQFAITEMDYPVQARRYLEIARNAMSESRLMRESSGVGDG